MIYLFLIPLSLLILPWLLMRYVFRTSQTATLAYEKIAPYLAAAAFCWVLAFFVPNIPISSDTDTFSQHAMGGVVAAILFFAAKRAYEWTFDYWWQLPLALYFFASGLGVVNELFELFTTQTGIIVIDSSDVWWDLLANTFGVAVAYGSYLLASPKSKRI